MYNNYGSVSIYHNYCGYGSVVFNITIMLWFTYFLYRHLQNDMNVTLSYELVYVCSCSAAVVCGGRGVLARGSHSLSLSYSLSLCAIQPRRRAAPSLPLTANLTTHGTPRYRHNA